MTSRILHRRGIELGVKFVLPPARLAMSAVEHGDWRVGRSARESGKVAVYNALMPFRGPGNPAGGKKGGKAPPPEDTLEEPKYLKMLGEQQKTVTLKLVDGEVVRGWIEYYDKNMLRLTREGAPNLFIFKHDIVYIAEEPTRRK